MPNHVAETPTGGVEGFAHRANCESDSCYVCVECSHTRELGRVVDSLVRVVGQNQGPVSETGFAYAAELLLCEHFAKRVLS